jgi:hypothetical protein
MRTAITTRQKPIAETFGDLRNNWINRAQEECRRENDKTPRD